MQPFDADQYRRRVLAAVHARGGADNSDPFEIYDIPLDEVDRLSDREVATRVREVWAFWQKSRDHPRYRGVVLSMLAVHGDLSAVLADRASRLELRDRVRAERDARDGERFAEVDAAVARLVERFGGLPEDKLAGLTALAATRGIDADTLARRVRRYRVLPAGSAERSPRRAVPVDVLRQVRADLDELGRITGATAPASLFDLLGVPPGTPKADLRRVRDDLAARNRARRPDRRRALIDDLLAAVTALLVDGDPEAYLDALAATATEQLRPRVAAAVLVEDRLLPQQHAAFVAEATAAGCDPARARAVVDALAREHGVEPPAAPAPSGRPGHRAPPTPQPVRGIPPYTGPVPQPSVRPAADSRQRGAGDWQSALSRARAALRAGRPIEASDEVSRARELAGETLPPIRAVGDEVEAAIRGAARTWEALTPALAEGRHAEVLRLAEALARTAADVPGPGGQLLDNVLAQARERVATADALVARAQAAPPGEQADLLGQALRLVADHESARAALEAQGVEPPSAVQVRRDGGAVVISWEPSPTAGEVRYRVRRVAGDGSARAVGVTAGLSLSDGGAPAAGPLPAYEVTAGRGGVWSPPARWAAPGPAAVPASAAQPAPATQAATAGAGSAAAAVAAPGASPAVGTAADAVRPATDLQLVAGRLRWRWPGGCTEMVVVWRPDAPPLAADDPAGHARKVTNTRYEIDGGVALPPTRPLHIAVFACLRDSGRLVVAGSAAPSARTVLADQSRHDHQGDPANRGRSERSAGGTSSAPPEVPGSQVETGDPAAAGGASL